MLMTMHFAFSIFQVSVSSPIRCFQMLLFFAYSFRERKGIYLILYITATENCASEKVECNAEVVSFELKALPDDTLSVDLG